MADSLLQHKQKVLAGTGNVETFLEYAEVLTSSIADVRTKIPGIDPKDDTLAVRAACAAILKESIDTIRRIRNNSRQRPGDSVSDDPV